MKFNLDLLNKIQFSHERNSEILQAMKKIYPNASEEQLREGKENLENYLRLALKISARLLREKETWAFDSLSQNSYDGTKVESNSKN